MGLHLHTSTDEVLRAGRGAAALTYGLGSLPALLGLWAVTSVSSTGRRDNTEDTMKVS